MSTTSEIRVVKSKDDSGVFYGFRRVYFASKGSLEKVEPLDFTPYGESVNDLRQEQLLTTRALNRPVVDNTKASG